MIIFSCSPPDDECIQLAKDWISKSALDRATIRLVKNERYVAVIRDVEETRRDERMETDAARLIS